MDWKYVGCPECHLNNFSVKTARQSQAVQAATLPAQTPYRQQATTFQISCSNCHHVLVALEKAA